MLGRCILNFGEGEKVELEGDQCKNQVDRQKSSPEVAMSTPD
jgi:hypothetical protein